MPAVHRARSPGQALTEWALILALITLVAFGTVALVGQSVLDFLSTVPGMFGS